MNMFNPQQKQKAYRNKKYLAWIRTQPPLLAGTGDIISHHIRIDGNSGMGLKPSDLFAVPLHDSTHKRFHNGMKSDREFFEFYEIDVYRVLFNLLAKWMGEKK